MSDVTYRVIRGYMYPNPTRTAHLDVDGWRSSVAALQAPPVAIESHVLPTAKNLARSLSFSLFLSSTLWVELGARARVRAYTRTGASGTGREGWVRILIGAGYVGGPTFMFNHQGHGTKRGPGARPSAATSR